MGLRSTGGGTPAPVTGPSPDPFSIAVAAAQYLSVYPVQKEVDNLTDAPPQHGNQAAYAAYKGVSRQTVTDWKQAGLLVFTANRLVDFAATDRRLADQGIRQPADTDLTESPRSLAELPTSDGMWSKADAETVKENYAARLKQLEYDRESAKVVEIDDVVVAVASEYSVVRDRVRQISAVASSLVLLKSAEEIKAAIDAAVIEALADLSTIVDGETDIDVLRQDVEFKG